MSPNLAKSLSWIKRIGAGLFLAAVCVFTIAPTPCNLRVAEYPGSSEKEGREGTCDVFAVDHELLQPVDLVNGTASGVRQHRALTVLKVIDRATPGFHKALVTGQNLNEVILDFYRIDPATRQEAKYYTITLKNARIIGLKTLMPTSFLPENESYKHMEEVRFVYRDIQWKWIPDEIIEGDSWGQPAAARSGAPVSPAVKDQPPVQGLAPNGPALAAIEKRPQPEPVITAKK